MLEQGRHRYYRLADDDVAARLEAMALPRTPRPAPSPGGDPALRLARTCYRHLAGRLGVALCEAWLARGWLVADGEGMHLAEAGAEVVTAAGLVVRSWQRLAGRGCLDWTERKLHLGGPLGVALTDAMLEAGWLRRSRQGRALLPGDDGLRQLAQLGVRAG